MSSSKLIRPDELSAYERWELPNMTPREARGREEEVAAPPPMTAEQIEAIQQAAYQEGYELGRKEGREAGAAEVRGQAQRLRQIVHGLAQPLEELDKRLEEELVELALAVARQIVRRELQAQPGEVVAVVREALTALPSTATKVKLHLHPEDAALVRETLSLADDDGRPWKVVEEPVLTRGGCRVTSTHSRIDATVEKRLNAVIAQLFGGERASDRDDQ
jgi:flagellar assembly protein FliH